MLAIDIFVHFFQGNKQVDNVGGNEKFKTFHIINDTMFDIEIVFHHGISKNINLGKIKNQCYIVFKNHLSFNNQSKNMYFSTWPRDNNDYRVNVI